MSERSEAISAVGWVGQPIVGCAPHFCAPAPCHREHSEAISVRTAFVSTIFSPLDKIAT